MRQGRIEEAYDVNGGMEAAGIAKRRDVEPSTWKRDRVGDRS
jgi:hypothetical protein